MGMLPQHRPFLSETGPVNFLYLTRDVDRGMLKFIFPDKHIPGKHTETQGAIQDQFALKACYVGVGELGSILAKRLCEIPAAKGATMMGLARRHSQTFYHEKSFAQISDRIENQHLIFLTGSIDDQAFWLARDLILSIEPNLLITIAISQFTGTVLQPAPNEGVLLLQEPLDMDRLACLLLQFYAAVTGLGYICVGFDDFVYVLSGSLITPLTYEATWQSNVDVFADFLRQNEVIIQSAPKLVYTTFSEDMEKFEERTSTLVKLLDENADIIVHDNHDLNLLQPDFRFKMQILCATEPHQYVYRGWPFLHV